VIIRKNAHFSTDYFGSRSALYNIVNITNKDNLILKKGILSLTHTLEEQHYSRSNNQIALISLGSLWAFEIF
jgi:hypothetical protein